jgi:hypothetical protein
MNLGDIKARIEFESSVQDTYQVWPLGFQAIVSSLFPTESRAALLQESPHPAEAI